MSISKSQVLHAQPKLNDNYIIINQSHNIGSVRQPYVKLPNVGHAYGLKPDPNKDTTKTRIFIKYKRIKYSRIGRIV